MIKSEYRKDIKQINSFLTQGGKLSYNDALKVLNTLKSLHDYNLEVESNLASYREDYGQYYAGVETNWDEVSAKMDLFKEALSQMHTVTPQLKDTIINGQLPTADIEHIK